MFARIKTDWTSPGYPDWDRRANAMPDQHRVVLAAAIQTLQDYFAGEPMVYVSGNTPVYFRTDGRRSQVIPDVYVVRNVSSRMRRGYRIREEGKPPDWVLELPSASSVHEDAERKFALYEGVLVVPEYFLFDPAGDSLDPRLQGYCLRQGRYQRIVESKGRLLSRALGLQLEADGAALRFYDPATKCTLGGGGCTDG
ncbi:MAG TPA: Uma2 family endonuclease [Gemmataceae bacterium]|nr:Uma2 family endonuclease [Gemmataceae bacterium]